MLTINDLNIKAWFNSTKVKRYEYIFEADELAGEVN